MFPMIYNTKSKSTGLEELKIWVHVFSCTPLQVCVHVVHAASFVHVNYLCVHACTQIVYATVYVKLNIEIETVSCFSFGMVGRKKCMKNFNIKEITVLTTSNVHSLFVSKQTILTKVYLFVQYSRRRVGIKCFFLHQF